MGCTASRPELDDHYPRQLQHHASPHNDWYHPAAKGISMPATNTQSPSLHDFNIVPLSPSSYGISMNLAADHLEGQKQYSGYGYDQKEDSIKQMLQVLESLDMGTINPSEQPKRRGGEVSSILEDLKPGLEKHFNQALGKPLKGPDQLYTAGACVPVKGKENANPDQLLSARSVAGACDSPTRQIGGGSTPPGPKPSRSKPTFAIRRFLKKSSSSLGSQKSDEVRCGQSASAPPQPDAGQGGAGDGSLFDADFLASYESALQELSQDDWNALKNGADQHTQAVSAEIARTELSVTGEPCMPVQIPTAVKKKREDPLEKYERLCPPGGEKTVVLYTTSLRGIRKTFEDCNNLRSVLESFQVSVDERDVAMHQGFRNELREMMGNKPVPVPRLFIKGRYIGGADEVLQLHEEEELAPLLQSVPQDSRKSAQPCDGCGGARFVPCLDCSGSRKVVHPENPKEVIRCPDCNENGLIHCPICS